MTKFQCFWFQSKAIRLGLIAAAASFLIVTAGCGKSSTSTNPAGAVGASQVRIGDAPADKIISFEVTVGPITLSPGNVSALSGTRRVELTHLSGTSEPLALLNVPPGTYTGAQIMVSKPEITFVNSLGQVVEIQPAFSQTVSITFPSQIVIGQGSSVLDIDLNVANSLTFDALGNVTGVSLSNTSFTFSASAVAADENNEQEDNGEQEDITGMVTAVNGTSFDLQVGQSGTKLTFATDATTEFSDGATLGTMLNTTVTVEGVTKADGSLYAKEVEGIEDNNGVEAEGLITSATGNPATALTLVDQDGSGNGLDDTKVGTTLTVNVNNAQYKVGKGNIDTSGIGGLPSTPNFPFDATTVHAGQSVEVESSSALSGSSITAQKVKLHQQGLSGTVSGLAGPTSAGPVTFTLNLDPKSAFAVLSGQTTVTVFWQPGTDLHHLSSVNNNNTVRVRGLVFFTGTGFNMIARRIRTVAPVIAGFKIGGALASAPLQGRRAFFKAAVLRSAPLERVLFL